MGRLRILQDFRALFCLILFFFIFFDLFPYIFYYCNESKIISTITEKTLKLTHKLVATLNNIFNLVFPPSRTKRQFHSLNH